MEHWACGWEGESCGREHQNLDKVWGLSPSSFTGSIFFFFKEVIYFFKEVKTLYQDAHRGILCKVNH